MTVAQFNAATDPWVPVLIGDGHYQQVSLVEALRHADEYTIAAGSLTDHALYRFLLAVAYTAADNPTETQYRDRSTNPALVYDLVATISDWVSRNVGSFNLFDEQAPFLQDSRLDSEPGPVALLDPTVARNRPLLSDHRTLADTGPVDPATATRWLITTHCYHPAGKFPGLSESLPTAALTGQTAFRPAGVISEVLRWGHTPTAWVAGSARWTYADRGESTFPVGVADGYGWLARRIRLLPNVTGQVDQVAVGAGWRRGADSARPTDTIPGRADVAVAKDTTKPLVGAENRPLPELVAAWHRGSPQSLAGWVRATADPDNPPAIVATAQALNQGAWLGVGTTHLPAGCVVHDPAPILQALADTRPWTAKGWVRDSDVVQRVLVSRDVGTVAQLTAERATRPGATAPSLPRSSGLWTTSQPVQAPEAVHGGNDEWERFLVPEPDPEPATTAAALDPALRDLNSLRTVFHRLRTDPDLCRAVAYEAGGSTPDLTPCGLPEGGTADLALAVTAAAVATWLARNPTRPDGKAPFAVLLGWAHLPDGAALLRTATTGGFPGARTALVSALTRLDPNRLAPNWVSLYDDLTRWDDPAVRRTWREQFYESPTAPTEPEPINLVPTV